MTEGNDDDRDGRPSKSARKREIEELQTLAGRMCALSDKELARLGVDARLRDALALVRPMQASGARNRQLKHCVKFMDPAALDDVRAYLDDRNSQRVAVNRGFHELERWRDRLVDGGDDALQALFDEHPALDRQRVRQLCRDAIREKETGKPAGAARKLFRHLRDALMPTN